MFCSPFFFFFFHPDTQTLAVSEIKGKKQNWEKKIKQNKSWNTKMQSQQTHKIVAF